MNEEYNIDTENEGTDLARLREKPAGLDGIVKKVTDEEQAPNLIRQARLSLGNALIRYLSGSLFNKPIMEVSESLKNYLTTVAPFVLRIMPDGIRNDERQLLVDNQDSLNTILLRDAMVDSYGEYVLRTDLFNARGELQVDLRNSFPQHEVLRPSFGKHFDKSKVSANPYIIGMALKPHNRPLYSVCVDKAISKGIFDLNPSGNLLEDVRRNVLPMDIIVSEAQRYKITALNDFLSDLTAAVRNYSFCWSRGSR